MMHENEQVPDIEKLEHWEFNLDLEEQERVQEEAEQDVARVWQNGGSSFKTVSGKEKNEWITEDYLKAAVHCWEAEKRKSI